MQPTERFFGVIGDLTWGWALIPILVVLGLFFTVATGFCQLRYFGRMFRVLLGKNRLGGPGAVFWMWAIALVGMTTSLIECSLAQLFKRDEGDGNYRGGPARSIIHGLGADYRWLAVLYAVCVIAAFGLGFNAFQGNTVAGAAHGSLGIERLWTGLVLAAATGVIVYGGIHRIAKVADVIVPVMALGYIVLALLVIAMNIGELPRVLGSIFANAFGLEEAVSGGMGAALSQGLRRGLFSNEAGLG